VHSRRSIVIPWFAASDASEGRDWRDSGVVGAICHSICRSFDDVDFSPSFAAFYLYRGDQSRRRSIQKPISRPPRGCVACGKSPSGPWLSSAGQLIRFPPLRHRPIHDEVRVSSSCPIVCAEIYAL